MSLNVVVVTVQLPTQKLAVHHTDRFRMKTVASLGGVLLCFSMAAPATAADGGRYPTSDEAFYVLACMELNGQNADGLHKCSCAINAIEAQLPYQQYSEAVLVFAMRHEHRAWSLGDRNSQRQRRVCRRCRRKASVTHTMPQKVAGSCDDAAEQERNAPRPGSDLRGIRWQKGRRGDARGQQHAGGCADVGDAACQSASLTWAQSRQGKLLSPCTHRLPKNLAARA